MAQIFAAFGKFQQNNKGSVQNFGIIGITITAEEITKFIFFYCPCNYPMNQVYGSTFIWGPAAILLVVGYVINRRTWRLMTGMCNRTQGIGKAGKRIVHFLFIFANISMKAILAPATWVVLSFLKGDYYTCAAWPDANDPSAAAKFNLKPNTTIPPPCFYKEKPAFFDKSPTEIIARDLRAYSHIIGWWFLTWTLLVGIFMVFVFRCLSKYSYEQSKYIEKYRTFETQIFDEALDTKAKAQAKIIVDQFFSKSRAKEEWEQIASINDKVMKSKRGRPIYSPLHKFSNKELVALELAQEDIVTNSAQKKRHLSDLLKKKKGATKGAPPGPSQPAGSSLPPQGTPQAATVIPMVSMAPAPRVVVKNPYPHPHQPSAQPSHQEQTPKTAEQQQSPAESTTQPKRAEVEPEVASFDSPPDSPESSPEDDPIKEAMVPSRNSIVLPVVDNDEEPILEANIENQVENIRRSMQDLEDEEDVVEATEEDIDQYVDQDVDQDVHDSEPLL